MLYSLRNIIKKYKDRSVLDIPSLDIEEHMIYSLLGPNGSGKTTLLKILALVERPTEGAIHFLGDQIAWGKNSRELRKKIVLLDQSPIMFSGTVFDNVAYGLKMRSIARKEIRQRVEKILTDVGMSSFTCTNARLLSGGETKRVALARAMVLEPQVLLCDEPTANVDSDNQAYVFQLLRQMCENNGTSLIFSTHYPDEKKYSSACSLYLQNGKLAISSQDNSWPVQCSVSKHTLCCQIRGTVPESGADLSGGPWHIHLPLGLFPFQARDCLLQIDPVLMRLSSADDEKENRGIFLLGNVISLRLENGYVVMEVHAEGKLTATISMTDCGAGARGYLLGQQVCLHIPYRAFSLHPL